MRTEKDRLSSFTLPAGTLEIGDKLTLKIGPDGAERRVKVAPGSGQTGDTLLEDA